MRYLGSVAIALVLSACSTASAPSIRPSIQTAPPTAVPTASAPPPLAGRLIYGWHAPQGVELFTANTDGTHEQALPQGIEPGAWSPSGDKFSIVGTSPKGLIVGGLLNPNKTGYTLFDSPDPSLNLGCVTWSPDATRLACEGWDDANPTRNGIYTVRASDGGDLLRVTTNPDGGHDAPGSYTPDGSQIVFLRINLTDEEHDTLMAVSTHGGSERVVTHTKVGLAAFLSPDGTTILTEADGSLLLVPVGGGEPTPIKIDVPAGSVATRGDWSPDGKHIVFSLALSGLAAGIYTMRSDGTDLRQVTHTPGRAYEFGRWGPS